MNNEIKIRIELKNIGDDKVVLTKNKFDDTIFEC